MKILHLSLRRLTRATASALVCMAAAMPVMADTANEAQARYRQDMAACNNGQSSQDPATCRLEARNALAEARRGGLTDPPGQYQGNALQRCVDLPGDNRSDCESRLRGEGRSEGSVQGGGILRETVTIVPAR